MIDINGIEESVLIEAQDFNMPVLQLYNEISVRNKSLSESDARSLASRIIGAMVAEGLVTLVRGTYREIDEDCYSLETMRDLSPEETDLILKRPDRWEEKDVFSLTETYELAITERGTKRLDRCR